MKNMSDDSDFQYSDDNFDEKSHEKIVENVLTLNKSQNLKKPSRTEPTLQVSEFNLVKSVTGKKSSIQIDNLTKVLKHGKKHIDISKKVEATKKKSHTLPKPLEKPQAERIRRSVGYEKNRFLFDRWEAFVTSSRAQAHQVFPLNSDEKLKVEAAKFTSQWKFKSDLQKELEKLDAKVEEYHIADENDKNEFPLTLQELKEKRKEAAKLRAHQSFKEAKARRQNKIKSKKYHRILRKEKIKQKLKEFEELQKTNPEEALKKLEEIEKARALERFSLRHKSTGQWAKSKQVRAKYDKESRQVLAQQLQISRDLTQKQKHLGSDSEDEGFETEETYTGNPWVGGTKLDKDVTEFVSSYKKFWTEQSKKTEVEQLHDGKPELARSEINTSSDDESDINESISNKTSIQSEQNNIGDSKTKHTENKVLEKKDLKRKKSTKNKDPTETSMKMKKKANLNNSSGDWDIEDMFDNAETKIKEKLKMKLSKTKDNKSSKGTKKSKTKKNGTIKKASKKIDLSIPSQSKRQIIDEEMIEQPLRVDSEKNTNIDALKNILGDAVSSKKMSTKQSKTSQNALVDPEKFMMPKVTNLDSAIPDLLVEDENSQENNQKKIIIEAFEDNDIIDDFTKEKKAEVNKDQPKDIDLNLPGWGSWAGTGINPKKQRKRRRFIVKMPEVMPRRDDNKGTLIINEKAAAKVKLHLVSEVPFPFKTVKDYEASIRAPIGNTFVPELAYRRFIRPAVETRMGAIIEPVTTGVLMGKPKKVH